MNRLSLIALILLAACNRDQPPAPTARESADLNEAEDMLNDLAANEEGPEDRSPGPANTSD